MVKVYAVMESYYAFNADASSEDLIALFATRELAEQYIDCQASWREYFIREEILHTALDTSS